MATTWTVEEARAYLPRLRELVALVREGVTPDELTGDLRLRAGAEHAEAALDELLGRGIVVRQLDHGLVDFPSIGDDGELRFLCWQVGEPDLAWWHRPEDGYAGRRPLP